jgi:ABC-type lipoprotein export system ATPase subunit
MSIGAFAFGFNFLGGVLQGIQAYSLSKSQAKVAENNARYASELALNKQKAEEQRRQMKAEELSYKQRRRRAQQEAFYAKSGVLLDGTPSNYLQSQAETDELNLQRQNQSSYQRQLGIIHTGQVQKVNYMNQASAYKWSGKQQLIGGFFGGASSALSSASQTGFSWMGGDDSQTPESNTLID